MMLVARTKSGLRLCGGEARKQPPCRNASAAPRHQEGEGDHDRAARGAFGHRRSERSAHRGRTEHHAEDARPHRHGAWGAGQDRFRGCPGRTKEPRGRTAWPALDGITSGLRSDRSRTVREGPTAQHGGSLLRCTIGFGGRIRDVPAHRFLAFGGSDRAGRKFEAPIAHPHR